MIWNVPPADHGQRARPVSRFRRAATYYLVALLAVASASASESLYEIYYQHRLKNETDRPLTNV
ncbi:MAG TPA: hypothetical protein VM487_21225, partial [Phycisphaerae bacterium]|nr:hypothetical protein [Phycisphaerae bacterium]